MPNQYDKIFKESLKEVVYVLLEKLLGIKAVNITQLDTKLQVTDEREADFLLDITLHDGSSFIQHIEFQADNYKPMPYRMLRYRLYGSEKYKKPIKQILFYIGKEPLRMKNYIREDKITYEYDIIDFRTIDCEQFMNADTPEEIVIAILCDFASKDATIVIRHLLTRIKEIVVEEAKRSKYIRQLEVLSQLRGLHEKVSEEVNEMALVYDIEQDVRYRQGMRKGIEKGKFEGKLEGKLEGLLEGIQLSLDIKFGSEGVSLMNFLYNINNIEKLEKIKNIIKDAASVEELKNKVTLDGK
ncbi:hypothetical protein [Candidatus Magnetomonas plexicatena]|uniref:hypothetical protein n=1 Tax=Candidatus Magnetomonas plexicatena TaxID=2552947 RepID=UPI001C7862CF|nr:hypothetical protein E2O03_008240 [Nitrospirales bacterium LBB_01]